MTAELGDDWRTRAVVEERKITVYLLSDTHSVGRFKARFLMRHGFDPGAPDILRNALLKHVAGATLSTTVTTAFGTKYVAAGPLWSPDGRDPLVLSIWFEAVDDLTVRLVTVYPRGGHR